MWFAILVGQKIAVLKAEDENHQIADSTDYAKYEIYWLRHYLDDMIQINFTRKHRKN